MELDCDFDCHECLGDGVCEIQRALLTDTGMTASEVNQQVRADIRIPMSKITCNKDET